VISIVQEGKPFSFSAAIVRGVHVAFWGIGSMMASREEVSDWMMELPMSNVGGGRGGGGKGGSVDDVNEEQILCLHSFAWVLRMV